MAKAGRPKNGSAGLPEWFDIEKYRVAKEFGAMGWFRQLVTRDQFFKFAEFFKKEGGNLKEGLHETFALIKESPVITRDRIFSAPKKTTLLNGEKVPTVDAALGCALFYIDERAIGVRDVDYNLTSRLVMALKEDWQLALAAQLSWRFIRQEDMPPPYREIRILIPWVDDFFPALFDKWETPLAAIDLSLPDEALMKDFAAYLKEKRKRRGEIESPFFKSPDFSSWYDSGVLAYLDLMLWEIATGEPVRWAAFADALNAIVDEPVGGEGTLSKTTKAHAKKLMDARTIRMLQSQAMREKAGADEESGKLVVR
jgi:hypothetical protein